MRFPLFFTAVLLSLAASASANGLRYVDREGRVHFIGADGRPASVPETPAGKARLESPEPPAPLLSSWGNAPRALPFDAHVCEAAATYQLPANLIRAVIKAESNFQPQARSPVGAMGLMQLMPGTADLMGVANPYDPQDNIRGGSRYLRKMLDRFGGDLVFAIAAYHAGPGAVQRFAGLPPYPDTRRYVQDVLENYFLFASGAL